MGWVACHVRSIAGMAVVAAMIGFVGSGCSSRGGRLAYSAGPLVVVVAPVLNLSGSSDLDTLKLTDIVASEFVSGGNVSVVPVNLTLAALARRGLVWVETPEDALELAREFGADATVVTAVTEFNPYDPPIVGLVMQWYAEPRQRVAGGGLDPVAASREAGGAPGAELSADSQSALRFQVQRVFDASHNDVLDEVRRFAGKRGGYQSPHGWRRWTKSQELYFRFCTWSLIHPIRKLHEAEFSVAAPHEVSR